MSPKFEYYKDQFEKGWITTATLKQWVKIQPMIPALGITAEEYKQIAGEDYEA